MCDIIMKSPSHSCDIDQLTRYLLNISDKDNYQSACRTGYSIETTNVHRDITEAVVNKCMATWVVLDLSASFDFIDHGILQKRLEYMPLEWLEALCPGLSPISLTQSSVLRWEQAHQMVNAYSSVCHNDQFLSHVSTVYTLNRFAKNINASPLLWGWHQSLRAWMSGNMLILTTFKP